MKNILLTGGTGLVGKRLTEKLQTKNYTVKNLSRSTKENSFLWDLDKQYIDEQAFEDVEAIIHLAGSSVSKRWTKSYKKEILNSRVESTNLLFNMIKNNNIELKQFISASGVNFYGTKTTQTIFAENNVAGNDFLAQVCVAWEQAAQQFNALKVGVSCIRTGVVLAKNGGVLKPMVKSINNYVGSPLGSGDQYMSWIHLDDLCDMYIYVLENNLADNFNAVAPTSITNKAFTKSLAKALHKPLILPNVPSVVLKILMGEMANLALEGSQISSQKIMDEGFTFTYPTLNEALKNIYP